MLAQLLRDFPGLEGQSPDELVAAAAEAGRLGPRKWLFLALYFALAVTALAIVESARITLNRWWEHPLPDLVIRDFPRTLGLVGPAVFLRIWWYRRRITRLVAARYPTLYCPCGYCLRGRPPAAPCPECGTQPPTPS